VDKATRDWAVSPKSAFENLDRAADLNPLSAKPHLTAATIAVRLEDQPRAFREFREVLDKEPRTAYALAQLAALSSERGERGRAIRLLERAREVSPRDEVVRNALSLVRSRRRLDSESLNQRYLRVVARFDRE
jgi:Flp pilus assembly protein TadD